MRKVALFLAIVIVVSTPLTVFTNPRVMQIVPSLTFNGTKAICEVTVSGDATTDYIVATMTLMRANNLEARWQASGYGYVYMSKQDSVIAGRTYKLLIEVTVNGVAKDPVYITAIS